MKLKYPLNPVQLHLVEMFSWCDPKDTQLLNELKELLLKFYQEKSDKDIDQVCQEKGIDQKAVDQMINAHYRLHNKA